MTRMTVVHDSNSLVMQKGNEWVAAAAAVGVGRRTGRLLLGWEHCRSHRYLCRSGHKGRERPGSRQQAPEANYHETTVAVVRELEHL